MFSMYYICHIDMYILPILLLCPTAGAREMQQQQRRRGLLLLWGLPCCWPAWVAPLGRHTRRICCMSLQAMKSVNKPVVVGLAGMACNPASWNGSGRNMHKYAKNVQLYVKDMHKIWKYIDCISQICKRFARQW